MVDLAEDLECLCQIMKTCGKVLDKPKAKVRITLGKTYQIFSKVIYKDNISKILVKVHISNTLSPTELDGPVLRAHVPVEQ